MFARYLRLLLVAALPSLAPFTASTSPAAAAPAGQAGCCQSGGQDSCPACPAPSGSLHPCCSALATAVFDFTPAVTLIPSFTSTSCVLQAETSPARSVPPELRPPRRA